MLFSIVSPSWITSTGAAVAVGALPELGEAIELSVACEFGVWDMRTGLAARGFEGGEDALELLVHDVEMRWRWRWGG